MSVPLSDTRLTEIEVRAAHLADYVVMPDEAETLAGIDVPDLVAEVRRLRAVVGDHEGEVVRYDADHERLSAELNAAKGQVRAASTVKCWTNEDGRRFVFAEDLAFALGYTPTTHAAPSV